MKTTSLPSDLTRIASLFMRGLGSPIALDLDAMIQRGDWTGLLGRKAPDPRAYSDSFSYYNDAAAVGLLRKYQAMPVTIDRRKATIDKWWEGERQCYQTNLRLTSYLPNNQLHADRVPGVASFLNEVKQLIAVWIGDSPGGAIDMGRFGPGSTYSDRGDKITVPHKMASDPTLTPRACRYVANWLDTSWGRTVCEHGGTLSYVEGNRFATAPKTALIDRAIASEPALNIFYQLGYGGQLKKLLASNGCWDLKKAQEVHREVAMVASVFRDFATLDLSNASDTVAKILVEILLPHRWFKALLNCRSPKTFIDGRWVVLEKFSSMGNGYTFELETIIFAALCCVAVKRQGGQGVLGMDVYVFGDDIIIPDGAVRGVVAVLNFCGFTLNDQKSFWGEVPFRESCGGDYFDGKNVRPFHLEEELNGPEEFISFANGLKRVVERRKVLTDSKPDLRAWFACLDQLPLPVRRCRGPESLGDIVIWDEEPRWQTRKRNSIRYIRCFRPWRYRVVRFDRFAPSVVLACATYGLENYGTPPYGSGGVVSRPEGVIPRDGVKAYKVGWVPYS